MLVDCARVPGSRHFNSIYFDNSPTFKAAYSFSLTRQLASLDSSSVPNAGRSSFAAMLGPLNGLWLLAAVAAAAPQQPAFQIADTQHPLSSNALNIQPKPRKLHGAFLHVTGIVLSLMRENLSLMDYRYPPRSLLQKTLQSRGSLPFWTRLGRLLWSRSHRLR